MKDLLIAFVTIFMAEIGDKTQLLAFAFSTKYQMRQVLIGVFLGSLLNHGMAILFASILSQYAPISRLKLAAAFMFIVFGLFSLKLDYEDSKEDEVIASRYGPIFTVTGAFFLGELGDKTQLAAMTVAIQSSHPLLVLLGTTIAMVAVSLIGILLGRALGKKIPEVTMKFIAAAIFLTFGFLGIARNLPSQYRTSLNISMSLFFFILLIIGIIYTNLKNRNKLYAEKIAQLIRQCKRCEVHQDSCPIASAISSYTVKYLGQELPYLGKVISYLESMKNIDSLKSETVQKKIERP